MPNVVIRFPVLIILCLCMISGCAGGNDLVVETRTIENVTFDELLEPVNLYSPLPDAVYRHSMISPDRLKFAYNTADGVYIYDLAKGGSSKIAEATHIVYGWSPNSSLLILGKDANFHPSAGLINVKQYYVFNARTGSMLRLGTNWLSCLRWSPDGHAIYWMENTSPFGIRTHRLKETLYYIIPRTNRKVRTNTGYVTVKGSDFTAHHVLVDLSTGETLARESIRFTKVDFSNECNRNCRINCDNTELSTSMIAAMEKPSNPVLHSALGWKTGTDVFIRESDDGSCSAPPRNEPGLGPCGRLNSVKGAGSLPTPRSIQMEIQQPGKESRYLTIENYAGGGAVWYPKSHTALLRVRSGDKIMFLKINDKGERKEISLPDDGNTYVPAGILADGKTILVLKLDKNKKNTASLYTAKIR